MFNDFNAWYVVAPMFVVLAALLGCSQYKICRKGQIRARFENRVYRYYTIISTAIVSVLVYFESRLGIAQALIDGAEPGDIPFDGKLILFVLFCAGMYAFAVYFVAMYASALHHNTLEERVGRRYYRYN